MVPGSEFFESNCPTSKQTQLSLQSHYPYHYTNTAYQVFHSDNQVKQDLLQRIYTLQPLNSRPPLHRPATLNTPISQIDYV
jgi:hypothetical protein